MVGSTEMAARLEDEDYREIVRLYHGVVVDAVNDYKGYVAQYLGDGIVAYFGWPKASGDDAERAVRAALEILAGLERVNRNLREDRRLAARVGIHTGRAILSEIGAGARRETTALGETPNVAARAQALAAVGSVVITEATNNLIGGRFVVEPLGPFAIKGLTRPMPLYRVLQLTGVRNRLHLQDRVSPFIGRHAELTTLIERWDQASRGAGQVIVVRGEPGIGKSRLVRQFAEGLRATPHTWIEGYCSPFSSSTPFAPIIDGLTRAFLQADEKASIGLGRIQRALAAAAPELEGALPVIAEMLNVPPSAGYTPLLSSPEQKRARFMDAIVDWILALARLQPFVAVLEDTQWADPSTLELGERLVRLSQNSALMLIYTARPEFNDAGIVADRALRLDLGRLSPEETVALARASATNGGEETVGLFAERSGGIPLFVEELARMMAARGGEPSRSGEIPATLADLLMARLDGSGSAKEIAQIASIFGREFTYPLLRAVSAQPDDQLTSRLQQLLDADLIQARGDFPQTRYLFKHALIRDVAYESLLRVRRRALHNAAAQALTDKSDPATLAYHHAGAGNLEAASRAWQAAGDAAARRGSLTEASTLYARAIAAISDAPRSDASDQLEMSLQMSQASMLSALKGLASPEAEKAYNRVRELGSRVRPNRSMALLGLWQMHATRGEGRAAQTVAEQRLKIAEHEGNATALCWSHLALGMTLFHRGGLRQSLDHLRKAVDYYGGHDRAAAFDAGPLAMAYLAVAFVLIGETAQAREQSAASLRAARELESPSTIAYCMLNKAAMHWFLQEQGEVRQTAQEGMEFARAHGLEQLACGLEVYAGWATTANEESADAPERVRRAIAGWLANGQRLPHAWYLSILASVQARVGEIPAALATLDEAAAAVGEMLLEETIVLCTRAETLRLAGDLHRAECAWLETIASAKRNDAHLYVERARMALAEKAA